MTINESQEPMSPDDFLMEGHRVGQDGEKRIAGARRI